MERHIREREIGGNRMKAKTSQKMTSQPFFFYFNEFKKKIMKRVHKKAMLCET